MTPIQLLALLMVAKFSGFHAENSLSQYWEENIGLPLLPRWLTAKASPLTLHEMAFFMNVMEENELASHLHSFCLQANIACSSNLKVKHATDDTNLPPIAPWNDDRIVYEHSPNDKPLSVAKQGGLPFFRKSMVKEGSSMLVPDLRDPLSYKSFLPRPLASKIPFSYSHIKQLKKLFGVVDESNMAEYMQNSLETCETIQDEHSCLTSIEDLIDFVIKKLGHQVNVWSTESIEGSYENVTIGSIKLLHGSLSEPPLLCHSQPFPFQVYYCHALKEVKVYAVDIHAQKKVNHAVMACHYDTSTWNPNHTAFKLLGFGPSLIEVCHWINENALVWTKAVG